jgi:predicted adenylyl cyclase CyaB
VSVRELELKAVVKDPAALVKRLEAAGAALLFRGVMSDRRFDRPDRALLARDEVLRVRTFEPAGQGARHAEVSWKGPTRQSDGYKEREELQLDVANAVVLSEVLARLGYEVSDAVDRCVEYYDLDGAVVRIEWYPRMDVLVEVEGAPGEIERAVAATGIPRGEYTADRLLDFAARYQRRTGEAAGLRLEGLGPDERPGWPPWGGFK